MEKASMQQFCYKLCSFLPTILVLVLFSFFLISESSLSLLTTLVALFSTMFLVKLTRKKGSIAENLFQDNLKKLESQPLLLGDGDDDDVDVNHTEVTKVSDETAKGHEQQGEEAQIDSSFPSDSEERFKFLIMDKNLELIDAIADPHSDSSALPSDSETSTTGSIKSQGFQNDHRTNENLGISDSLAYDDTDYDDDEEEEEDGLIEIKLPNSNFFGLDDDDEEHEQKLKCNNFPEFLPESIFKHKGLMELLEEMNEMNEDENLIEIDLSIGSTKCQDFRVKQEL